MLFLSQINRKVYYITFIHFIVTLFFDSLVFNDPGYFKHFKFIALKLFLFVLIFIFWFFIFHIIKQIKEKNKETCKRVKFFLIYFTLMAILLICVWPGIWVWDEFWIYQSAVNLKMGFWHHYLTSIFYTLSLMILPFAGGIILVQLFIISLIVSYIIVDLSQRTKYYYIVLWVFLFPPVLLYNVYPMRVTLYSFILLYVLYYIYYDLNSRKIIRFFDFLPLLVCMPIVAVWRSEGIVILPFILLLLLMSCRKKIFNLYLYYNLIGILLLVFILNFPQSKWNDQNKDYTITAFLNPLSMMLQHDNLVGYAELEKKLSALVDLDVLKENADYRETPVFWDHKKELFISNDNEDFKKFKSAYFQLVIRNPLIFFKARNKTFWATSGMTNDVGRRVRSGAFDFDQRTESMIEEFRKYNALNESLPGLGRTTIIHVLEGSNPHNPKKTLFSFHVFWNLVIMFVCLFILTLISLIRKDIQFFLVCTILWALSTGIYATAPASYFMYYFPIYLSTYVLAVSYISKIQNMMKKSNLPIAN